MSSFSHPQTGFELDWLAVDSSGHVGLFSTGGRGPVPAAVVQHLSEVQAAVLRLNGLPVLGECTDSPGGGGNFSFWIEPCRRGLFGFDWGPVEIGPYARLTVPSRPVAVTEIEDGDVRNVAGLVRLRLRFAEATSIDYNELGVRLYSA